jgi:hypothetical protein
MTASDVRKIERVPSESETAAYTKVISEIVAAQKRGQQTVTTRTIQGYPFLWERLEKDGFDVRWDSGWRLFTSNVPSVFVVSWVYKETNDYYDY